MWAGLGADIQKFLPPSYMPLVRVLSSGCTVFPRMKARYVPAGRGAGLVRTQQKRVTPPGKPHSGGRHWAVAGGQWKGWASAGRVVAL